MWPGSVVGIATDYGLDGPGIESRWGRDFPHLSRPTLRPTQPPVQWVPGLSQGSKERPGRETDPSPLIVPLSGKSRALYLYSPYGSYGLYRASVPVQGCTLPYLYWNKSMKRSFSIVQHRRLSYILHEGVYIDRYWGIKILDLDMVVAGSPFLQM